MTNVHGCTFPLDFTLENQGIAETQWRNFFVGVFTSKSESLFSTNQNRVFTMSSWSYQVKIRGLKSSIEVQLPTVSGNLKKILYSCLCTSFVICYCVLTEKIDENDSIVTIDHFSRLHGLRIGSLLVSFGDSNVWPGRLLQATVLRYHSTKRYPVEAPQSRSAPESMRPKLSRRAPMCRVDAPHPGKQSTTQQSLRPNWSWLTVLKHRQ